MWEVSLGSESVQVLVIRVENSTSWWGLLWELSPAGSRFRRSWFRDVSGSVPESFHDCGFKMKSCGLDRAPKIRDTILLKPCDNFLVNLPSFYFENSVMYSSFFPGINVFCDWLFLGWYWVSPETVATFAKFLTLPPLAENNWRQRWWLSFSVIFNQFEEWQRWSFRKNDKLQSFALNWQKGVGTNNTEDYIKNFTFVSLIYTFFV